MKITSADEIRWSVVELKGKEIGNYFIRTLIFRKL